MTEKVDSSNLVDNAFSATELMSGTKDQTARAGSACMSALARTIELRQPPRSVAVSKKTII
jgi:hypothetical protein